MKLLYFATILLSIPFFSSCESYPELDGSWTGTPDELHIAGISYATAVTSITFQSSPRNSGQGDVTISSLIKAGGPLNQVLSISTPYDIDISATATISGTWSFEEDENDEVLIFLDHSTLSVTIDPETIMFSKNTTDDGDDSSLTEGLRRQIANMYSMSISREMGQHLFKYSKLDDVKVVKSILSFEIDDRHMVFRSSEAG